MKKTISLCAILLFLHLSTISFAALIYVNNHQDLGVIDGNCDLRDAIESANTNTSIDGCSAGEVNTLDGILIQVNQAILLTDQITITGSTLILTDLGVPAKTIIAAPDKRIFHARPSSLNDNDFSVRNLRLVGGVACCNITSGSGGAIYFDGSQMPIGNITLHGMVFENNVASTGGAVAFRETFARSIEITGSTFLNNTSTGTGGAIFGSDIISNAVSLDGFSMTDNLFISNRSEGGAGAVYLVDQQVNNELALSGNVYLNNSAASSGGVMQINITGNQNNVLDSELFMFNSAAGNGGALLLGLNSHVEVKNSFMLFNQAESGGAIAINNNTTAFITLKNSTVAYNSAVLVGDNLYRFNGNGRFQLLNSIISNPINGDNCDGSLGTNPILSENNLVDDASCEMLSNTTDLLTADAQLSGFSAQSDVFPGFLPTGSSPAIDSYECTPGGFDFNGNPRPMDGDGNGNAACDRGATEAMTNTDLIWSDAFGL